ncbi:MAG: DUF4129 domain-containing protein [Gemmatimonadota bacterium]
MQLPGPMIRDTVAAVFSDPAYGRPSLLRRIGEWLLNQLAAFFNRLDPAGLPTAVFWVLAGLCGAIVIGIVARVGYQLYTARQQRGPAFEGAHGDAIADAWALARRHAAHGDYTAAAHALYAGLLQTFAKNGEVQLDDAKTIGDYIRELAARSSSRVARFREFARSYETVIYGLGFCDRERFERLEILASRIASHG